MVFVPPGAGEKFYARLLLSVVTDVRNFQQLKTVDGVPHPTYREACLARGLLADDNEWKRTLEDGYHMQTGPRLRQLFVAVVANNQPSRPAHLWDLFKTKLCDDLQCFLSHHNAGTLSDVFIFDYGLYLIQMRLQREDKTMQTVGLPTPTHNWNALLSTNSSSLRTTFDPSEQGRLLETTLPLLNREQRFAFSSILEAAIAHAPLTFFLQGAAGAGKTFVYNTLCYAACARNLNVLCVASSGIAALLLPGGRTAHSTLKIPIEIDKSSTCSISKRSAKASLLRETHLLIWDKCSMQNRLAFEAVDRTLQDVRGNNALFGGVTTVLRGDFLQKLPVFPFSSPSDTLNAALISSPLWPSIEPHFLKLEKNMRVGDNPDEQHFALWQRQLARGELNDSDDTVAIPDFLHCADNSLHSLIECTYPNLSLPHGTDYYRDHCILTPCNREAHEINDMMLARFPGQVYDLWSIDEAVDPDNPGNTETSYSPEVLHSACPSGFPQAHLRLKIGCPVIVLRNLHSDEGICNGTRGIVSRVSTRVVEVVLLDGNTCLIPRIKLISADQQLPFHLHRHQFPLALSFAITINKSQGQSFSTVGIDLRIPAFAHGQVYVAFSRGRSCKNTKCILSDKTTPHTKNIVLQQAIL